MRRVILFLLAAAMVAAIAGPAGAQTTAPPFSIRVQQGSNVQIIGDGGTLAFPSDGVGLPVDGNITITYTGVGSNVFANLNQIQLTGATDFALTNQPDLSSNPLNFVPGGPALGVNVRYTPLNSKGASGRVTFLYATQTGVPATFSVNLTGTAPEFAYTYQVLPNGNSSLLAPGATVAFPQTAIQEAATVQITLTNRGTGTGAVNDVALKGSDRFALAGVQFLPASVDAGKSLTFRILFTPDDFPAVSADVQVDFAGKSLQFKVTGSGLGPWYEYALIDSRGVATPLAAGALIKLPDANVGGTATTVTVRVTNTGNDFGSVTNAIAKGTGFITVEAPVWAYTLAPKGSLTFKIQFSPTQPGKAKGSLQIATDIGPDNFDLEGNALGSNITYAYTTAAGSTPVVGGGTVALPAVAVGDSSTVRFTIKNDGTATGSVNLISAAGTGTVFGVSGLPGLPGSIDAGGSIAFTVTFAPINTGISTGTLRVDGQTFILTGVGNPPAALPSISFSGASGASDAQQQPAIGLALAGNYALALNGTLTLKFTSDVFADDPSVQFSSGGRTVAFTIPAGSKQAVFGNGATQMKLQTGTVAGTVTLTPTFATAAGAIDLTPATPPTLTLTVPQSAPRLLSVVVSSKVNNTLTLFVTGYATGRNITQMDFQFTAVTSETLGTSKVTVPVDSTFSAWYQGTASAAYGSLFTATVPFSMNGDIKDTKNIVNLVDTLQSVSVTLTNRQGVSSAVSAALK